VEKRLKRYRSRIDGIDRRIVRLLKKRYELVQIIGEIKRNEGLAVVQPERENEVLERIGRLVQAREIREFVTSVYRAVFRASYRVEDGR